MKRRFFDWACNAYPIEVNDYDPEKHIIYIKEKRDGRDILLVRLR